MYIYDFTGRAKQDDMRNDINKEWLRTKYENKDTFFWHDLISEGVVRCMGWCYVLRDDMNHYLYKQYGEWHEGYAPNKTLLRKNVYGRIDKIIDMRKV